MSPVDPQECQVLADLARLSLSPSEARDFGGQIGKILGSIEQLQSVDVAGVPEYLSARKPDSALRPDDAGIALEREVALANVPRREGALVAVPKFKED